ncbi:MAG: restriction endonuclease subunit S [Gammaproteobacteria bacterium]|nr:restriction endonuclease subunit S [Gammaproteobacteria bacterium]
MAAVFMDTPIEALCKRVTSGSTPLRSRADYYDGGTIDWYKTGELDDWYLDPAGERITARALEETSVKLFPANTVLMAMYGDGKTITNMGMLRFPAATNQACCAMLVDEEKCDPRYFFYALKGRRDLLLKVASGGAQRNLSGKLIKEFQLPVPPFPDQQRIAGILSAYDELIENSQRRIKILETMARALYREWFVHFRFPGHENHPRVASTLGDIPKGWEVKKLGDISSYINRGITPRYDEEGDSFVINQKCVRDRRLSLEPARRQSKAIPSEKQVCFGDVLINSTGVGTLGRVAQVYENLENCTVDTHVTIARAARNTDLDFYGCCLLSHQDTFERLGIGATGQTELGRASISEIELVAPPTDVQRQFGKAVKGMRSAAVTYSKQIQNLRRTRDLLLPRLLSGQIEVGAA